MENQFIKLKMKDILLGTLSMEDGYYVFCGYPEGFSLARMQTPIIPFALNEFGKKYYNKLPYPFSKFLEQSSREDIQEYLHIEDDDTDFEKLIKYAKGNIEPEMFYITL